MRKFAPAAFTALSVLALAGIGLSAINAQQPAARAVPGAMDRSRVQAGRYAVDSAHTLVGWSINHFGFSDYFGMFGNVSGTMNLDPANIEATRLDVTVPVADVTVASAELREHLFRPGKDGAAPDFFGPGPAPARFVSTSARRLDENSAIINGQLTLNGITKPVSLVAEFTGAGTNPVNQKETVGFSAYGHIKRSDWGITYGIPFVADNVGLRITAAFERQGDLAAEDQCGAGKAASFVGQPMNDAMQARIIQTVGHQRIRWIAPGMAVTMDYRPGRLNVSTDEDGTIARVNCN